MFSFQLTKNIRKTNRMISKKSKRNWFDLSSGFRTNLPVIILVPSWFAPLPNLCVLQGQGMALVWGVSTYSWAPLCSLWLYQRGYSSQIVFCWVLLPPQDFTVSHILKSLVLFLKWVSFHMVHPRPWSTPKKRAEDPSFSEELQPPCLPFTLSHFLPWILTQQHNYLFQICTGNLAVFKIFLSNLLSVPLNSMFPRRHRFLEQKSWKVGGFMWLLFLAFSWGTWYYSNHLFQKENIKREEEPYYSATLAYV